MVNGMLKCDVAFEKYAFKMSNEIIISSLTTLENTFAWYGEQSTQGVYVCIRSVGIVKLSKVLVESPAIVRWQIKK